MIKFFHFSHGLTGDISKAYQSIWITPKSQSLSRFFWVENKDDITSMKECLWTKCTYSYGPTSIYMEIILREPVAESTSKPEVKTLLNDNRFVDDLGASDHDHITLVEEVEEYIRVCSEYGFEHGEVPPTMSLRAVLISKSGPCLVSNGTPRQTHAPQTQNGTLVLRVVVSIRRNL